MANLPDSLFVDPTGGSGGGPSSSRGGGGGGIAAEKLNSATVDQLILFLRDPVYRDDAINLLIKRKETFPDLALSLWNSFNTAFIILKEVIDVYKLLTPSKLTMRDSVRVCNALALFECIASHERTKMSFIRAKIPVYLYPFLNITENEKPFEYLRLTSLGVIGGLVKVDDPNVVQFLLESEIFPLCLRCMESGCELSKAVATFIVSKILLQEQGLQYCCAFSERFFAIEHVLRGMVEKLPEKPVPRLIRDIIFCYLRLSEMPRVRDSLKRRFPPRFKDVAFINMIQEDPEATRYLKQLFYNVVIGNRSRTETIGDAFRRLAIS